MIGLKGRTVSNSKRSELKLVFKHAFHIHRLVPPHRDIWGFVHLVHLVHWSIWSIGPLVHWSIHWSAHWSIWSVHWSIHWSILTHSHPQLKSPTFTTSQCFIPRFHLSRHRQSLLRIKPSRVFLAVSQPFYVGARMDGTRVSDSIVYRVLYDQTVTTSE